MIMRRFIYILVSIIISYLICVYEYNTWNFIVGLEPSPACERLAEYAFYFVIWYWVAKAVDSFHD